MRAIKEKKKGGVADWYLILTVCPTPLAWKISSLAQATLEISALLFSILILLFEHSFLAIQHMLGRGLQQASYQNISAFLLEAPAIHQQVIQFLTADRSR